RVNGAADGLHVVLNAQEEAAHRLTTLCLTDVEEGRGRRLETAVDNLVHKGPRRLLVAIREAESDHADALGEADEAALTVEGLQGVGGVVLVRPEEGLEAELLGVSLLEQRLDEGEIVLVEDFLVVVLILNQVLELLRQVVEENGVLVDVLQEELVRGLV